MHFQILEKLVEIKKQFVEDLSSKDIREVCLKCSGFVGKNLSSLLLKAYQLLKSKFVFCLLK